MTPEKETATPAVGSNYRDISDATSTRASETSESSSINGVIRRGLGGHPEEAVIKDVVEEADASTAHHTHY